MKPGGDIGEPPVGCANSHPQISVVDDVVQQPVAERLLTPSDADIVLMIRERISGDGVEAAERVVRRKRVEHLGGGGVGSHASIFIPKPADFYPSKTYASI